MDSSLEDYGIRTLVHTKSGSLCRVHDFGATVLGFHPTPDQYSEVLFVSGDAELNNGSRAIRGGIPICFPIFGPPSGDHGDMPQHGFARINHWKWDPQSVTDAEDSASMSFQLSVDARDADLQGRGTTGLWAPGETSPSCHLTYTVTLTEASLTCRLTIRNTGTLAFPVQALLHTYYEVLGHAALDGTKCFVKGLQGYDKVGKVDESNDTLADTDETVTVEGETDRVYSPPADQPTVNVQIALNRLSDTANGTGTGIVHCAAKGWVDGSTVPVSCVVWNPHEAKAKAMSDFRDEQYHDMLCVEPGILGKPLLEAGKEAVFEMLIQVK